jgi:hypothetical protein
MVYSGNCLSLASTHLTLEIAEVLLKSAPFPDGHAANSKAEHFL